jgi:hypothetical protein
MKINNDEVLTDILLHLMASYSDEEEESEMDVLIKRIRAMRSFCSDLEVAKILAEEGYEAGLVYLCIKVAKLADEEEG